MRRRTLAAVAPWPDAPSVPTAGVDERALLPSLVIVGGGMAAHRLCRELVDRGAIDRFRVTICAEEVRLAYDRVHLTDYLEGSDPDALLLSPRRWYDDHGIEVALGDRVVSVDRTRRFVRTASGAVFGYDRLVLATGSSPFVPPIEGAGLPGVFVYRTVDDLDAMRARAQTSDRAAIIGGGLLGLEAARALQRLGLEVTIVEVAAALMPAQLDQRGSDLLARDIRALGIGVRTGTRTARIEAAGRSLRLHVDGADTLEADLVVIAAGVRPRGELAGDCGLTCSAQGAVVVDDRLRTSDPYIHAIGECASHDAQTYGLVAPAYAMAGVLATNLAGGAARFGAQTPAARLKLLGVEVSSTGDTLHGGPSNVFEDDGHYRRIRVQGGRLVAALGVGPWPEFGRIQDAVARRARVWPWHRRRFERTGVIWDAMPQTGVAAWNAQTLVCTCLGITRGQLTAACQTCPTAESLAASTGASTVCGSCRPLLEDLVGAAPAASPRIAWGLVGASAVALAAVLAVIVLSPIALAGTIHAGSPLEVLWRDGGYRRATGFTLLALSALAALLSARKRIPRLRVGTFGTWRTAHAVIGILTLAAMAAHTGLRLGNNITMALAASFLAINVLGAFAGGATGAQDGFRGRIGQRWRSALVFVHVVAIWPLPVLVAFHVLAVYYF